MFWTQEDWSTTTAMYTSGGTTFQLQFAQKPTSDTPRNLKSCGHATDHPATLTRFLLTRSRLDLLCGATEIIYTPADDESSSPTTPRAQTSCVAYETPNLCVRYRTDGTAALLGWPNLPFFRSTFLFHGQSDPFNAEHNSITTTALQRRQSYHL